MNLSQEEKEKIGEILHRTGKLKQDESLKKAIEIFELGSKFDDPGCNHSLGLIYCYEPYREKGFYDLEKSDSYFKKVIEAGYGIDIMALKDIIERTGDQFFIDHYNDFGYSLDGFKIGTVLRGEYKVFD